MRKYVYLFELDSVRKTDVDIIAGQKALYDEIHVSALDRQEEKLSAEKAEIVKQCVTLYEEYADGNICKEEFIRQWDAYRVQEDERMGQIQRLRTEKDQIFQPVKKNTDNLQAVMDTVREAGDVMHLSQNVVDSHCVRPSFITIPMIPDMYGLFSVSCSPVFVKPLCLEGNREECYN